MISQDLKQADAFLSDLKDPILLTKGVFIRNLCNNDAAFFHSFNHLNLDQIAQANQSCANSNIRKHLSEKKIGFSVENIKF